jgi:hypothetical protein
MSATGSLTERDTDNQEFTLSLNAKITSEPALPASRPKIISMHAGSGRPKRMGLFGASFFESQYYFADTPTATICMSLASPGNIMISNIDLFKGADLRYREYEHGLLIVNPSTLPAKYTQTSVPLQVSKPAYHDQLMKRLSRRETFLYCGFSFSFVMKQHWSATTLSDECVYYRVSPPLGNF